MEKLVPPNIFLLNEEEVRNMSIKSEEFYAILIKRLKEKPDFYCLNIPETIVKGFGTENGFLVHVDDGVLMYSEEMNSHTVHKFFRRCSFYRANGPVCVVKMINKTGKFETVVLSSLSEVEKQWKKANSIVVQRYVGSKVDVMFKARIWYIVGKESFVGKIFWKDRDEQIRIGKDENVNEDEIRVSKAFREQMRSLRGMMEVGIGKVDIGEIVADFLQDHKGEWFFIEVFSVKFEKKRYKPVAIKKVNQTIGDMNESYVSDVYMNSLQQEIIKDFEECLNPKKKPKKKKIKKLNFPIQRLKNIEN